MAQKFKRRKLLVDVPFQLRMILRFTVSIVCASFVVGILIFCLAQTSTTGAIEKARVFVKPPSDFILPVLVLTVLSVAVIAGLGVMFMTLFVSHRIVGPVFRIKKEVDLLRQGQIKRNFSTREKDQLKDLSKCLQDMTDTLHGRHCELRKNYGLLREFLETEQSSQGPAGREKLKTLLSSCQDNLDYFKV